ncbi:alpha-1,2-fucosyltransferase [Halosimplex amylolyticum]|uniref:alpha-1,2-fucosyltransferase n=1 Tax=Halosimplex amylolyticum TaxID=3396616 RepID=UPI003F5476D3
MVVLRLKGGLGNQLFQYATGRAIANRTGSELVLDITHYRADRSRQTNRNFQLSHFDIAAEVFSDDSRGVFDGVHEKIATIGSEWAPSATVLFLGTYSETEPLRFDPRVLELPGDVSLIGYWQTERYFQEFDDLIRTELSVTHEQAGGNERWGRLIENSNSVSVHFRRGDYESFDWTLPTDYYSMALDRFAQSHSEIDVFVFSDDIEWVKNSGHDSLESDHLDVNTHFVDTNDGSTAYEDLRLMRQCDHNVIANSTFSWWGAWLNENENKTVLAPPKWPGFEVDASELDVVPARWTILRW